MNSKMPESKVGRDLADKVAKRMLLKCDLMYDHRDYCGTGLTWEDGKFIYGKVYEGQLREPMKMFDKEEEFVAWLAEQSDESLSGHDEDIFYRDNQRLTIGRLFGFVNSKAIPRI